MTRIERILQQSRITLADKQKERWSDEDLISILSDGHQDLCRHSQILHGRVDLFLSVGEQYYTLPDDVWMLTRVTYDDRVLPLISHPDLDDRTLARFNIDYGLDITASDWETITGEPLAILYDRRNVNEIKVFPIPDESILEEGYAFKRPLQNEYELSSVYGIVGDIVGTIFEDTEGVLESIEDFDINPDFGVTTYVDAFNLDQPAGFDGDEVFGVTVGIDEYTLDSLYGVATSLYDPRIEEELLSSDYGVIVNIQENKARLRCYYLKVPDHLVDVDSDLLSPPMFDNALKYYVVGHAFMNDLSEEYQQKGAQQLQFYNREIELANKTSKRDATRASQYETGYRGAF